MKDLVKIEGGQVMVSSKDVSDKFKKIHRDVLRAIKLMDCSNDFRERNFAHSSYVSLQNKNLDCVNMTRDGFMFLCMGFTGEDAAEWKEAYIKAFNAMEGKLIDLVKTPPTLDDLSRAVKEYDEASEIASFHGKGLSQTGNIKKEKKENVNTILNEVQLAFKI